MALNVIAIMFFILSMVLPAFESRFQSIPVIIFAISGYWLFFMLAIGFFAVLGLKYPNANFMSAFILFLFIMSLSISRYMSTSYVFGAFKVPQYMDFGIGFYTLIISEILLIVCGFSEKKEGIRNFKKLKS